MTNQFERIGELAVGLVILAGTPLVVALAFSAVAIPLAMAWSLATGRRKG